MPSLRELQRAFSAAALFGDAASLATLGAVAAGVMPETRIAIYRGNALGNYRKALAATYPVIERLVGAPFFDAASDHFVRGHPSTRGDVNRYGGSFADFLSAYAPARDLTYLPDVARLEWAVDQANIARDAETFDLAALAAVPAELHGELRFSLHPSVQLIVSSFPILHIWRANQPGASADEHVDLDEGGETLLIFRRAANMGGVVIEHIPPADHLLLAQLAAGVTLSEAAAACSATFPDLNLAQALQRYVGTSAIVGFRVPSAASLGPTSEGKP